MEGLPGSEYINKRQARIYRTDDGAWVITQLRDAVNVTEVNGKPCERYERIPLEDGDQISIGPFEAKIRI